MVLLDPAMTVAKSDYEVAYSELTRPGESTEETGQSCEERTAAFLEEADETRAEFEDWAEELRSASNEDVPYIVLFLSDERENAAVLPRLDGCRTEEGAEILRRALLDYTTTAVKTGLEGADEDAPSVDDLRTALDEARAAFELADN